MPPPVAGLTDSNHSILLRSFRELSVEHFAIPAIIVKSLNVLRSQGHDNTAFVLLLDFKTLRL